MSELRPYLIAAIAVRLGLASPESARAALEDGDGEGGSIWVRRGLLTPHQETRLNGLAEEERSVGESDPARLAALLEPVRDLMRRRGIPLPSEPESQRAEPAATTASASTVAFDSVGAGRGAAPPPEVAPAGAVARDGGASLDRGEPASSFPLATRMVPTENAAAARDAGAGSGSAATHGAMEMAGSSSLRPGDGVVVGNGLMAILSAPAVGVAEARASGVEAAAVRSADAGGPEPIPAAAQEIAEAAALREDASRALDAWLELARAPELRVVPGHRERTLQALERVEEIRDEAQAGLVRAEARLLEALRGEPANAETHRLLCTVYGAMALLVPAADRDAAEAHFGVLADHHRRAMGGAGISAEARLQVESEPAGAGVWLASASVRGWSWGAPVPPSVRPAGASAASESGPGTWIGTTPTPPLALAPGRYQLCLRHGGLDALVPVRMVRGGETFVRVHLCSRAEVPEGFALVPAGPYVAGNPIQPAIGETGAFAIAVFPVSFGAYCEYLDVLDDDPHELEVRLPRTEKGDPLCVRDEEGSFQPFTPGRGPIPRAVPVVGVTWTSASEYTAWRSAREAVTYRLPTRAEWEKAARGTDGSVHPWGNRFESGFCLHRRSAVPAEGPQPSGRFLFDLSPWGARDMAGNVMQWCADGPPGDSDLHWACGGAWNRGPAAALAFGGNRFRAEYHEDGLGFRIVHPLR